MANCDPAAAIMINIQISLTNQQYMEESATLSRTLFPYINKVTDYRFLGEECTFIANRFLNSLVTHVKDTDISVEVGFVKFALALNPRTLHGIFHNV